MKNNITLKTQLKLLKSSLELQELWYKMTSEEKNMLFINCTTLTTIPDNLFVYCTIPDNLFVHCTELTNFNNIFKNINDEYKN